MYDYGEYCPISKAAQILGERWTILILRELLTGVTRFNEFRKYLPRLSPTLLNARLRTLEKAGLLIRRKIPEQSGYEYQLTPAGRELDEVIFSMGRWAGRWIESTLTESELNVDILMRDIQLTCALDKLPGGRTVVLFQLTDLDAGNKWYLVADKGMTELCDEARALDVDVYVSADRRTLTELWSGDLGWQAALDQGRLHLHGTAELVRTLPAWFGRTPFPRREPRASLTSQGG